jgi:uncharacterized LabA/DUF88 family protein
VGPVQMPRATQVRVAEWPGGGGSKVIGKGAICRIGVFYDGSYFTYAQWYFYHERGLGWLAFQPFHAFLEQFISQKEQGFASYKVVYASWHQGLFASKDATSDQLARERNLYHDLMHAGVDAKYLPMSQKEGEKGTDVAIAVDALQVGLDGKIDIAVLATGDGDFVPLVRALNKEGIRVLAAYFEYVPKVGRKSFINERLLAASNYAVNINSLEKDKEYSTLFKTMFRRPEDQKK